MTPGIVQADESENKPSFLYSILKRTVTGQQNAKLTFMCSSHKVSIQNDSPFARVFQVRNILGSILIKFSIGELDKYVLTIKILVKLI
jgi:hypothetical protein